MQIIKSIDLLRHGKTTAGSCFLGSTDALLTAQGWQKMQTVVETQNYQQVISSPLKRCADFAQQYAQQESIPLLIESDLREMDFGDWEGKTSAEVWETQQQQLSAFWSDPINNTPPNAEIYSTFAQRVEKAFLKLAEENGAGTKKTEIDKTVQQQNNNVLIIAHGGVIRQIIACILSVPFKNMQQIHIDYAGLTRIEYSDGNMSLRFINHTA